MTSLPGVTQSGSILDRIVADNMALLEEQKRREPGASLLDLVEQLDPQWRLGEAIRSPRGSAPAGTLQIVAEIKRASPSKGMLAESFDCLEIARRYALAGAAGISVLTEPRYFLGNLQHLRSVRQGLAAAFPGSRPSLLRKDFLVEPYQVLQSRAYGADCLLLIVAVLETSLLRDLIQQARDLNMDALVEVHDEREAESAIAAGATLFGINNRDLRTFEVDLSTTERIRPLLPPGALVVGESGVHTREHSLRLQRAGVDAILVGEALMTAPDIEARMAALRP
jgi:indole-3-glycerol phosphate synthase